MGTLDEEIGRQPRPTQRSSRLLAELCTLEQALALRLEGMQLSERL